MKLRNILQLAGMASAFVLAVSSCSDFLDEGPKTALTEKEVYSDTTKVESTLKKLYSNWEGVFKDRHLWECMVGTDEIQSGAFQALMEDNGRRGAMDMYNALLTAELSYITEPWTHRWPSVGEAAKIINAIKDTDVDHNANLARMYGEACFIRGCLNMELTMLYGRIPIIDIARADQLGYGRQPLKDVWKFIINDLEMAAKYCPEKNEVQRATKYAACMMLGYAYMSAPEKTGLRNFNKAKEALKTVVEGPFELVHYADLFNHEKSNTKESIFEWQFEPKTNPNQLQFQLGSRAAQNSFGGDGCYFAGYDHAVPTEWAYSDVANGGIWESGDLRKEESIRYDYTYMGILASLDGCLWENIGDDHDELKPHIKKYEDYRTDQFSGIGINNMWHSGKNIPYLRLANVILLYAECLNEIGQTAEAVKQVNLVRSRAWGFHLPTDKQWSEGVSQEKFRSDIMVERVRELFGERWRRFDLVRTGQLVEAAKAHNKWTQRSGTIQMYHAVWPIPQTEINQNEDISQDDQNEGYR